MENFDIRLSVHIARFNLEGTAHVRDIHPSKGVKYHTRDADAYLSDE